jgi:hypothetical protein
VAQYPKLTEAEIHQGIAETKKAIHGNKVYLNFLATGRGLPRQLASREELAESHAQLIGKLEQIEYDLKTELSSRERAP